jgi:prepilin-type N-terminal cleavage/methylation domain-containing protein
VGVLAHRLDFATRSDRWASTPTLHGSPLLLPSRRRGFTFTEILFAVLILGIGFILVAAIFPVALRQTQATSEETVAATIAKGGVSYMAKYNSQAYWYAPAFVAPATTGTPDGMVHPIGPNAYASDATTLTYVNTTLWPLICGNLILPSDSRYAWVPMYRQVKGQPYVQIILIGVQARNRSFYDSNDLVARPAGTGAASLEARPLTAVFAPHTAGTPDTVTLSDVTGSSNLFLPTAAPGAYIVVANDNGASTNGTTNGWMYRLGNFDTSATSPTPSVTYYLAPGNDMTGSTSQPTNGTVTVLIVGAGYDNATATTYSGPVQDVANYTTFITVH